MTGIAGVSFEAADPDTESQWLVNDRVDDLDEFLDQLRAAGVETSAETFSDLNGRFGHCWDPRAIGSSCRSRTPVCDSQSAAYQGVAAPEITVYEIVMPLRT